jgi:hypothetical protein
MLRSSSVRAALGVEAACAHGEGEHAGRHEVVAVDV